MTQKFPFLDNDKQQVLRVASATQAATKPRAIVATAERERIVFYASRQDGAWHHFVRPHAALDVTGGDPRGFAMRNWSLDIGLATTPEMVFAVYKREIAERTALFVDALKVADDGIGPAGADPLPVPLSSMDIVGIGPWLACEVLDNRITIFAQTWVQTGADKKPVAGLSVLQASLADPDALADPAVWQHRTLADGGYDFTARRKEEIVYLVHRQRPAALIREEADIQPSGFGVIFADSPAQFEPDRAPLRLLQFNLATGDIRRVQAQLPHGEHPVIQHIDPLLISVEQIDVATLSGQIEDEQLRIDVHSISGRHALIYQTTDGQWKSRRLGERPRALPRHLYELDGCQYLLRLTPGRLELSTLYDRYPQRLTRYEDNEKERRFVILRADNRIGALVAHQYVMQLYQNDWTLSDQGMTVVDIGHAKLGTDIVPPAASDPELGQYAPFATGNYAERDDGIKIRDTVRTRSTMGGAISVDPQHPANLFSYVDMGDGGLRVFFEQEIEPLPPPGDSRPKQLDPGAVDGPGGGNAVWIKLDNTAVGARTANLPNVAAPYGDFLHGLTGDDGQLPAALLIGLFFTPEILGNYNMPRSLALSLQPSLDLLPFALALGGSPPGGSLADPTSLTLNAADTVTIQGFISSVVAQGPQRRSSRNPFRIAFGYRAGVIFDGDPVAFATTLLPDDRVLDLSWDFGDGSAPVAGDNLVHTYPAPGSYRVTLTATDTQSEETATVNQRITVLPTLWNTLWTTHDAVNDQSDEDSPVQWALGDFNVRMLRYAFGFNVDGNGGRTSVRVDYTQTNNFTYRFVDSSTPPGQGEIEVTVPIEFESDDIRLSGGGLASWVQINSIAGRYSYTRRYTPCVATSDRRHSDVVQGGELGEDIETITAGANHDGMIGAALTAKPVGGTTLTLDDMTVDGELTASAKNTLVLGTLITMLGLAAIFFVLVIPVLLMLFPVAWPAIVGAGVSGIVSALVAAGLMWLIVEFIGPPAVSAVASNIINDKMQNTSQTKAGLDQQNLLMYAGEGVMESLARDAIAQAQQDGLDVANPGSFNLDRKHSYRFETIVVGDNVCRIRIHPDA